MLFLILICKEVIHTLKKSAVIQLQKKVSENPQFFEHKPIFIFLSPPNEQELEKRLRGRATETEESLQKRLTAAKNEMAWGMKSGSVDHIVINDEIERAYVLLKSIVI